MKLNKAFSLFVICCFAMFLGNVACAAQIGGVAAAVKNTAVEPQNRTAQDSRLSGSLENGVRVIEVQAFKYGYSPNPIVVKEGEKVKLLLTSKDVEHGFGIADLNINVKIPPHKTTVYEFTPEKAGTYEIHCTVYCGLGHADMRGTLIVLK